VHTAQPHPSHITLRRTAFALLGALLLAAAIAEVHYGNTGWWLFAGFLIAPDLALLLGFGAQLEKGRLHRRAVPFYNAAHSFWGPALLAGASLVMPAGWLVAALAWALHIAWDRTIGYGMRTRDGFQRS
jgi:hypothetical protein